jgi:hypothetical protein
LKKEPKKNNIIIQVDQKDEMVVDSGQDRKPLETFVDVSLPELPCAIIGMNAVHMKSSENVMHISHKILHQRVVIDGEELVVIGGDCTSEW